MGTQIKITSQILTGNLGDGWIDQDEAACALAEYTESVWRSDVASIDANIKIDIDVCDASGSGTPRDIVVEANDDDYDQLDIIRQVEYNLTDESQIWRRFCASSVAAAHAA